MIMIYNLWFLSVIPIYLMIIIDGSFWLQRENMITREYADQIIIRACQSEPFPNWSYSADLDLDFDGEIGSSGQGWMFFSMVILLFEIGEGSWGRKR